MNKWTIADLTKCFVGTVDDTLNRVLQFCEEQGVPDNQLSVIVRADQAAPQAQHPEINWRHVLGDRWKVIFAVRPILASLCQRGADLIFLLSYEGGVLRLAQEYAGTGRVQALPLSALRSHPGSHEALGASHRSPAERQAPVTTVPSTSDSWPFEAFCPLPDALNIMIQALKNRAKLDPTRPLTLTDLRPEMARVDPRFFGSAALTGTKNIIPTLVSIAETRKIISVDRSIIGKPFFRLSDPALMADVPHATASASGDPQTSVLADVGSPPTTDNASPSPAEASLPPLVNDCRIQAPIRHPSREMGRILAAQGMDPFTVARLPMYDEIEAIFKEAKENGKRLSVFDMVEKAVPTAREKLHAWRRSAGRDPNKNEPWNRIRPFMVNLLTHGGCVLDEAGKAILPGFSATLAGVDRLADDWTVRADSEILLCLIRATDVTSDDVDHLARVLYHKRDDVTREKVLKVIKYLLECRKAHESHENGKVYLRVPSTPTTTLDGPPSLRLA